VHESRHFTEPAIARLRESHALKKLIGGSPSFQRAISGIPKLARGQAPVVINGETGTGKELVAEALHYCGPRAGHPFVAVNCGSLTDTLLEDELFGHERGAFTDARSARRGLLVQADRGTLFLDEVDSLTPRAQVALLRVLQDRTFRALGSERERSVDVRFLAASNRPLDELVESSHFRSDLYFRLCVLTVELPPLRERVEDVLLLADHFLAKHAPRGEPPHGFTAEAEHALLAHGWPGNVRELENVVLRARTVASGDRITPDELGLRPPHAPPRPFELLAARPDALQGFQEAKREALEAWERQYLTRLLRRHAGNVSRASRAAKKERNDLKRLLKKYDLEPVHFSGDDRDMSGD
jgi:DNA-binding NtrC family response regulator